jgi:hypothetical protein
MMVIVVACLFFVDRFLIPSFAADSTSSTNILTIAARLAVQSKFGSKRPMILRKDFVVDKYQIYEALVHGADTVLLIVAILTKEQLLEYLAVARSLGMVR